MTKKNKMNEKRCVIPIIRLVGITASVLIIMCANYSCASPDIEMVDDMTKTTNLSNVSNMMDEPQIIVDYVERAIAAHKQRNMSILADFWSVWPVTYRCSTPNTSANMNYYCGTFFHPKEPLTYWSTILCKEYKKGNPLRAVVDSFSIVEHPTIMSIYGVTLKLALTTGKFSDSGYMFMLWDFRNPERPQIIIRTWQPEYIDWENGIKLDRDDVFFLSDFDL